MSCVWVYTTSKNLKFVENIMRSLARLIYGKRKYDSISEELNELDWLFPNNLYTFNRAEGDHEHGVKAPSEPHSESIAGTVREAP